MSSPPPGLGSGGHRVYKPVTARHGAQVAQFKRAGSPKWYARFTPPGGMQTKIGLGTECPKEAADRAIKAFVEAKVRIKSGLTAKARAFAEVADIYVRKARPTANRRGVIERYFKAFFGAVLVDATDGNAYARYLEWRKDGIATSRK